MLYKGDFVLRYYVGFSQIRSHMRILPSDFGTITMPAHHGVACSTRDITPRLSILSNFFFTLGSKGIATRLGLLSSGVASPNLMPGQRVGSLIYPQRLF